MAGAAAFRAHRADASIGFGGGAALDVAKAIALMATHAGDVLEYAWDHPQVRADRRTTLPYFVALPTTAGTGSEVGRSLGDPRRRRRTSRRSSSRRSCSRRRCSPIRS